MIPAGYTVELWLSNYFGDLHVMVQPGADLDSTFKAWCLDEGEFLSVSGWTYSIDDINDVSDGPTDNIGYSPILEQLIYDDRRV